MRDEIVERAKLEFAATSPRAVKQIVDSMTAAHDEGEPLGRTELRFKAAQDILDRAGVTKKQEVSVESHNLHAVVILPQKHNTKKGRYMTQTEEPVKRKRGRPKKDPNAPTHSYNRSRKPQGPQELRNKLRNS